MQPITREELEKLIEEAKAAGKDTSKLEQLLAEQPVLLEPQVGEVKEVGDERVIISTGPAREEDFK
jgi:hypothetical protein